MLPCVVAGVFDVEMPCYHPIKAYQGSGGLFFWRKAGTDKELMVACGQCVGCRLERSRTWAARCMHEASLHQENCFITLTYREDPHDLRYRDFQLFMKRLRKVAPGVRFYMCGEYGEEFSRPHFHACLFGFNFPDRVPMGRRLFRSALLDRLWSHGYASIGSVTFQSAAYVARYIMKKVTGDPADDHYRYVIPDTGEVIQRTPEFCHMSLKPGIGARWLDRYLSDVYPSGKMVVRGVETRPPRYYDKVFKRVDRDEYELMKSERLADGFGPDNSEARLADREIVTNARVRALRRKSF